MNLIEQAKHLISKNEVKEATEDFLEDSINALLGDEVSVGKILIRLMKSPAFFREQLFWTKMELFLGEVYENEEDTRKLKDKLWVDGRYSDNPYRLLECIDRAQTKQKVKYLVNVTKCLLFDHIDLPTYFRICHILTQTLEEDLSFLGAHIEKAELPYSIHIQGLLNSGLVYHSVIDANGNQQYSFTPLAELIDRYAVSYDNIDRYSFFMKPPAITTTLPISTSLTEWQEITSNEIDAMFDN